MFGGVCLYKSAEIENCFLESVGDSISKVGVIKFPRLKVGRGVCSGRFLLFVPM